MRTVTRRNTRSIRSGEGSFQNGERTIEENGKCIVVDYNNSFMVSSFNFK